MRRGPDGQPQRLRRFLSCVPSDPSPGRAAQGHQVPAIAAVSDRKGGARPGVAPTCCVATFTGVRPSYETEPVSAHTRSRPARKGSLAGRIQLLAGRTANELGGFLARPVAGAWPASLPLSLASVRLRARLTVVRSRQPPSRIQPGQRLDPGVSGDDVLIIPCQPAAVAKPAYVVHQATIRFPVPFPKRSAGAHSAGS